MGNENIHARNMKDASIGNISLGLDFNSVRDSIYGLIYLFWLIVYLIILKLFEHSLKFYNSKI